MMSGMKHTRRMLLGLSLSLTLSAAWLHGQTLPAAALVVPKTPAPLERAALESKLDELLAAWAKVNGFSGTVLLASKGQPLFRQRYRLRQRRMADSEHHHDEVPHRLGDEAVHVDAGDAVARAGQD